MIKKIEGHLPNDNVKKDEFKRNIARNAAK